MNKNLLSTLLALALLQPMAIHAASAADKLEWLGSSGEIKVESIRLAKRNALLTVAADVLNTSNHGQTLYYRFKWLDEGGFTVGGEEGWKPVSFYGQQRQSLQSVAPSPAASDFRIELNQQAQ